MHWGQLHATAISSDHTYFSGCVARIVIHTLLGMHASHIRGVYPYPVGLFQWYWILLHPIWHIINTLRPFTCYSYPQCRCLFEWVCSRDCVPYPVDYGCKPWQICLSLPYVVIAMIWNTVAGNTPCHKMTAVVWIIQLPSTTVPILVGMWHGLRSTPRRVYTQAMSDVFTLTLRGDSNAWNYSCM